MQSGIKAANEGQWPRAATLAKAGQHCQTERRQNRSRNVT